MNVDQLKPIKLLFKNSDVLCNLTLSETAGGISFTPLIRALERAGERPDSAPEKTGSRGASEFFGRVQQKVSKAAG